MIDLLKKFFSPSSEQVESENEERKLWVATAAVFVEIATADGEFDENEKSFILKLLKDAHQLDADLAIEILAEAEKAAKDKIDLWQFTKTINKNFTPAQRILIVEKLWTLVLVDGQLNQHEEYLAGKLADLLHVNRPDFIDAKLKALRATTE